MSEEKTAQEIPSGFTLLNTLQPGGKVIDRIAWSPDGKMLACSCRDKHIYVWDVTGERIHRLPTGSIKNSITWSPDGRMLASSGRNNTLILWDTADGRILSEFPASVRGIFSVAWSHDGKTLAVGAGDGYIQLWDVELETPRTLYTGSSKSITSIAWSPNDLMFASGSQDNTVAIWGNESEQPLFLFEEHTDMVNSVVWSKDGKTLLSASNDTTMKIWDVEKKQLRHTIEGHTKPVVCIALSKDGQLLASKSQDGTVLLWETTTRKMLAALLEPTASYVWYAGISFHPKLSRLATLGNEDTIIRIWNLDSTAFFGTTVPMIQYQSAKVVVVGEEDVGKTRLSYALTQQTYPSSEPTQGCSVQSLSKAVTIDENGITEIREIYLWDMAGSHQYRLLHQLTLGEAALALIVFDAYRNPDDTEHFYLWDRLLRFAEQNRNLAQLKMGKYFVASRIDRKRREDIPLYFDEVINTLHHDGKFPTSTKGKGSGIKELRDAIEKAIPWKVLPKITVIQLFADVKNFIDNQKARGEILSSLDDLYEGFLSSVPEMVDSEELRVQFETLISQMETQGLIKKIHSDEFVLLKPELLDYYASALIDAVFFNDPDGLGRILESKVLKGEFLIPLEGRLKDKELEKIVFIAMVRYLQHHEFVYREIKKNKSYLVFPSLVTSKLPNTIDIGYKACIFRFEGPIASIYAKLAVRLSRCFEQSDRYKDIVIFKCASKEPENESGMCAIFLHIFKEGIGELTLSYTDVSDEARKVFDAYIYTYLLSHALKGSVKREQIVACSECGEIFPPHMVAHRRELDSITMKCSVCETEIFLDVDNDTISVIDEAKISEIEYEAIRKRDAEISITDLLAHSTEKIIRKEYDEILYYDTRDKANVERIFWDLMREGIAPLFNDSFSFDELEQASKNHRVTYQKAVKIFIGKEGVNQNKQTIDQLLNMYLEHKCSVTIELLKDAPNNALEDIRLFDQTKISILDHRESLEGYNLLEVSPPSEEEDGAMRDEIAVNRKITQEKIKNNEYDVFLSYSKADREHVITINRWLRDNGIACWRSEWDAQPGVPEQASIEEQIKHCKSAAVIIGEAGIGPDQILYIYALQRALNRRNLPIIPVFLKKAPQVQGLPILMEEMTSVDFRLKDPDPLEQLIFGITGQRPIRVYRPGILIASLGESPVVVSSMLRLLTETKRENLTIDEVHVLLPNDDDVWLAYKLVQEAFTNGTKLYPERLDFEDADTWQNACSFLQKLYELLDHYEKQGETVYLSLAGGRKSMASLMAWVVPYFSCVAKLYHVIDKNEEHFVSSARLNTLSASKRTQLMNPNLDQLILVDIPFENRPKINNEHFTRLLRGSPDTYDEIEAYITGRIIIQETPPVQVEVTKRVVDQFTALRKTNPEVAQVVLDTLLSLSNIETLRASESIVESCSHKVPKLGKRTFYRFTQGAVRPIFYTTPDDVFPSTESQEVEKVIICSLDMATEHQTFKQVVAVPDFPTSSYGSIDALLPSPSPAESVLIVPLGKMPMVATQLYTLLKEQEKRTIREVVLLYPARSNEIDNAARIVKEALQLEDNVLCTLAGVPELDDITSTEACRIYQTRLEAEIKRVQEKYLECHIDLALSGGRKGMTAMTIFAAQMNNIPYVYHTLVTDDALTEEIEEQTTVSALKKTGMSQRERQDRLFLRRYHSEDPNNPYENFVLFRVPIFNAGDSAVEIVSAESATEMNTNSPSSEPIIEDYYEAQTLEVQPSYEPPTPPTLRLTNAEFLKNDERLRITEIIYLAIQSMNEFGIRNILTHCQVPKGIIDHIKYHEGMRNVADELMWKLERGGSHYPRHVLGSFLAYLAENELVGFDAALDMVSLIFRYPLILDQDSIRMLSSQFQVPLPPFAAPSPINRQVILSQLPERIGHSLSASQIHERLESLYNRGIRHYVDPSFFKGGHQAISAVCRIEFDKKGEGTGFLVAPDLVLTNYHVFKPEGTSYDLNDRARRCQIRFGAKRDTEGSEEPGKLFKLHQDWLVESSLGHELDYILLRLVRPATNGIIAPVNIASETDITYKDAFVNIIHHPLRGAMEVSLRCNEVIAVEAQRIYYLADTEEGSSGAPVFDDSWKVIALHHAGGEKDGSGRVVRKANVGIPINLIMRTITKHLSHH